MNNQIHLPPPNAEILNVEGTTVDFVRYVIADIEYISFDSSDRGAPEPMVNALLGLRFIIDDKKRLVMINHSVPHGLFSRLEERFEFNTQELEDGSFVIEFFTRIKRKADDLEGIDNHCAG